jgi:hypothetical protein
MHAPLEIAKEEMPPPTEWGPAMAALPTDRQRQYVIALWEVKPGRGVQVRAAKRAGYGTPTSTPNTMRVIACRLFNDESIQLAVEEEGRRRFRTLGPLAHNALLNLLLDPKHRDHGKALLACLDHAMPLEMRHQHLHEHHHVVDQEAKILDLFRRLRKSGVPQEVLKHLFGHNGLPMLEEKDRKQRGVLDITATEIHERPETSVALAEATQPEEILQS